MSPPPHSFLTLLADFQSRPKLVAEITQGSHLTVSSLNSRLMVLESPTHALPLEDKDQERDIFSITDTETRVEVEHFHQTFSAAEENFQTHMEIILSFFIITIVLTQFTFF